MPAALFHILFGRTVEGSPSSVFLVGSEGPDVFYFHGQYPFRKRADKAKVYELGSYLHSVSPYVVYTGLFDYLKEHDEPSLRDYVKGLLCHYALDENVHPYVFYRSGRSYGEAEERKTYGLYHAHFEALLDEEVTRKITKVGNPRKILRIDEETASKIADMWVYALSKAGREIPSSYFMEGCEDMKDAAGALYGKTSFKKKLYGLIMGKRSNAYCMASPGKNHGFKEFDILNEGNAVWKHPVSGQESTLSVRELMDKAKGDYLELVTLMDAYISGKDVGEKLSDAFRLCHDGILPDSKMRHFEVLYDKMPIW